MDQVDLDRLNATSYAIRNLYLLGKLGQGDRSHAPEWRKTVLEFLRELADRIRRRTGDRLPCGVSLVDIVSSLVPESETEPVGAEDGPEVVTSEAIDTAVSRIEELDHCFAEDAELPLDRFSELDKLVSLCVEQVAMSDIYARSTFYACGA